MDILAVKILGRILAGDEQGDLSSWIRMEQVAPNPNPGIKRRRQSLQEMRL